MGLVQRGVNAFQRQSTGRKVALGLGATAGVAGLALGAKALFKAFKKKGRKGTMQRLRERVMKKSLKIKDAQLNRKLFKEQLRGL